MSPSKFLDSDLTKGVINGPRPLPLRINKHSNVIHKPSSSPSPPRQLAGGEPCGQPKTAGTKRQPVIIYTHSPKVIHTQARDFMALVQKLTGMSGSDDVKKTSAAAVKLEPMKEEEEEEVSFTLPDGMKNETCTGFMDMGEGSCSMYRTTSFNMMDAPLFTPNSNDYFCSSRSNSFFQSSNMANTISPTFMEYMKPFAADY